MNEASEYLLALARRIAASYTTHPKARAAMVTGSVAEDQSDFYSDIDMTMYYDELPSEEELLAAREKNGGSERKWTIGDRDEGGFAEAYHVQNIEVQIGHTTIEAWERQMAVILEQHEIDTPLHKAISGTLICIPLYGDKLIEKWKARAADYPPALAEAMVTHHLQFFPIWGYFDALSTRDAMLWRTQIFLEAAQNILGILAGLNKQYYTTFQFKRMQQFIDKLKIAPPQLDARIESLFTNEVETASKELEQLVKETADLVDLHMPEVDTSAATKRIGWQHQPWEPVSNADQS